ncbi:nectin-1 [Dicentrarchus labrax]|uniref:nectin-1 n=1 Tax=Dicentrarchus labrax TaxID=13489 RepID=UPI0021F5AB4B|nr:nectin-1 [Dicentrarchus labrax]
MFLLLSAVILSTVTEALRVTGGNMAVIQGGNVVLPCKLTDTTEDLNQISWQRKTKAKPLNENFFTIVQQGGPKFVNGHDLRFKFVGSMSDLNGSLQLSNVTLFDEGIYTCIFTLFPSGNHITEIPLNILVPPVSSLKDNHPALGKEEVSLGTCTAAASKPPAQVKWVIGPLEGKVNAITSSTKHDNDTTTTVSSLLGVPTREINQRLVHCVITSAALSKEETLPFTIQVYFAPMEVTIRERTKDTFECVTEANPNADITWSRSDNSWPQSAVRMEDATLQFLSMTSNLNGLYQCEASNTYGSKRGQLYVHVTSGSCTAAWTLFGILLFLNVAAAVWYLYKSGKFPGMGKGTSRRTPAAADGGQDGVAEAVSLHAEVE